MNDLSRKTGLENEEQDPLASLRDLRMSAPPDLSRRVMEALATEAGPRRPGLLARYWPDARRCWLPSLTGAAAALLAVLALNFVPPRNEEKDSLTVHFELHAPAAQTVELVGDFTNWKTGAIRLRGPDASGHWTADVELPAGRHEYIFLVDGRRWETDPQATVLRDDGFGRRNAVVTL